jgi:hypothetical protein
MSLLMTSAIYIYTIIYSYPTPQYKKIKPTA